MLKKNKSEIVWTLKCITSGYSNNSCSDMKKYSNQYIRTVLLLRASSLVLIKLDTGPIMALNPTLKVYRLIPLRKVTVLLYLLIKA